VSTPTWYSHIPPLLHIDTRKSRSSLCVERWRTCGLPSKSLAIARILTI
jgi:hypothetical protein